MSYSSEAVGAAAPVHLNHFLKTNRFLHYFTLLSQMVQRFKAGSKYTIYPGPKSNEGSQN